MVGHWRAMAAAVALAGAAYGAGAQQPPAPPPAPMVRPQAVTKLSPHVWVIPDESRPLVPNVGFVVGVRGVLVVDTGLGPRNGAIVAAEAARLAPGRQIYLVTTHAHPEHDLGAQAFPVSAKVIRSADQEADIADQGMRLAQVFAGRSPAIAELLKDARFRPADIRFTATYELDLGEVTAKILALGPNHTAGDTGVWVAADKVLFSGDVAMKNQPSIMAARTSQAQWLGSLDRLEGLAPAVVVPSHGPVGDVGLIRGYRAYLKEVAERTARAKAAGASLEAAQAQVADAMAERYPDGGRLAGAVRMAYAEGQ